MPHFTAQPCRKQAPFPCWVYVSLGANLCATSFPGARKTSEMQAQSIEWRYGDPFELPGI